MWAICVKFLRGVCVATDTGQWDEAEWPPHPARLFMAMAAAHFETLPVDSTSSANDQRRLALEWLEKQPAPRILASQAVVRTPVTVFVPVNDSTRTDQLLASNRSRQPRYFPTVIPDRDEMYYLFEGSIELEMAAGLTQVAEDVVRIGHSSSLVQVWIEAEFEFPTAEVDAGQLIDWSPAADGVSTAERLRIFSPGTLKSLEESFNLAAVDEYVKLQTDISESKGQGKANLKSALAERFPQGMPPSQRPRGATAIAYSRYRAEVKRPAFTCFDPNLFVLSFYDELWIGLESTLQLAGAVRKKIHDAFPDRTSPEWLGGHQQDGSPAIKPHMAIVPLPFTDHPHADGHLLGLALAFPREVSDRDRAIAIRNIFERSDDSEWQLTLRLHEFRRLTGNGSHCDITLIREQRLTPPRSLDIQTWTAASSIWETVTPIALDRFPKHDRGKERAAWNEEVAETIACSCENIGLPRPGAVHINHNAFVTGVPKARPKGGGFPPMTARDGKASRYQVHARIEFDVPVIGPVMLGAGRFVGYGFCRPNVRLCRKRRGF